MKTITVLTFDVEGRAIQFDSWLEDLQLYLQSVPRDDVSLYEHMSGSLPASDKSARVVAASVEPPSPPFLRGVIPPFSRPPLPLLLLLTSFMLRRSVLRRLLVGGAAAAKERGVRVVGVALARVVAVAVEGMEEVVAAVEVGGVVEAVGWAEGARVAIVVELVGLEALGRHPGV
ncbi:unnamed protein product [Closterium sp. NIES-65]|nr:unnamed protein product [Closterium sp. NIES-65]